MSIKLPTHFNLVLVVVLRFGLGFETESHAAEDGLAQALEYNWQRSWSSWLCLQSVLITGVNHPIQFTKYLGVGPRASCILIKHSANWASFLLTHFCTTILVQTPFATSSRLMNQQTNTQNSTKLEQQNGGWECYVLNVLKTINIGQERKLEFTEGKHILPRGH